MAPTYTNWIVEAVLNHRLPDEPPVTKVPLPRTRWISPCVSSTSKALRTVKRLRWYCSDNSRSWGMREPAGHSWLTMCWARIRASCW